MPEQRHRWIIDVLDPHSASVEVDGERLVDLPRWILPADAAEGDVLDVRHARDARASQLTIELDDLATAAARDASREQLADAPDGGKGDITL